MASSKPKCLITDAVAGPCHICGNWPLTVHVFDHDEKWVGIYCYECCPVAHKRATTVPRDDGDTSRLGTVTDAS